MLRDVDEHVGTAFLKKKFRHKQYITILRRVKCIFFGTICYAICTVLSYQKVETFLRSRTSLHCLYSTATYLLISNVMLGHMMKSIFTLAYKLLQCLCIVVLSNMSIIKRSCNVCTTDVSES